MEETEPEYVRPFITRSVAVIGIEGALCAKGKWVGKNSGETSYEGITAQALMQLIQQNDSDLIVGFAGDRPRCCIAVKRLADAVEFGTYAVAPELQGQGCGKALLQYAEAYARDWHHRFQVCVVSQNTALIDFYRLLLVLLGCNSR